MCCRVLFAVYYILILLVFTFNIRFHILSLINSFYFDSSHCSTSSASFSVFFREDEPGSLVDMSAMEIFSTVFSTLNQRLGRNYNYIDMYIYIWYIYDIYMIYIHVLMRSFSQSNFFQEIWDIWRNYLCWTDFYGSCWLLISFEQNYYIYYHPIRKRFSEIFLSSEAAVVRITPVKFSKAIL